MPLQWREWIDQKQSSPTKSQNPAPRLKPVQPAPKVAEPPRGFIAEWTVTIILLLFGTTTLVQAFVIPTGSMEDTLLVGDHLLVDKLAFAPGGSVTSNLLPYSDVHRGDIIVFRYPIDIKQTFVKRVMGVAGDRIRLENKKVFLNGHLLNEPYVVHKLDYIDSYRDNFPGRPEYAALSARAGDARKEREERRSGRAARLLSSRWAIIATSRSTAAIGDSCRARTSSANR